MIAAIGIAVVTITRSCFLANAAISELHFCSPSDHSDHIELNFISAIVISMVDCDR